MRSPQPFTILVVDDFELFRRSIRFVLASRPDFQIVGEASDGLEAVRKAAELKPHLILLDANLPKISGIDAAREIRKLVPESKIILMNYESDSHVVQDTLSLGISGYFVKTSGENELLAALEAVFNGDRYCSTDLADRIRKQVCNTELFRFELDSENKIFKAEFSGPLTSDSIKDFYRAAAAAALLAGDFRGSIADFSGVTQIHATPHAIRELAALPPADPVSSRPRVVVAPNVLIFALARLFQTIGKSARPNLHVVRNLSQAFVTLGIASPHFEPVVHSIFRGEPAEQNAQAVGSFVSTD